MLYLKKRRINGFKMNKENKKIILIDFLFLNHYSLGLLILKKLMKNNGLDVEIVNLSKEINRGNIDKKKIYQDLISVISNKKPTHVGFSAMSANYVDILVAAKKIKKELPEVTIFLGGPQASLTDEATLTNFPSIDFIYRGEVEGAINELSEYIKGNIKPKKVPNLSYRKGGEIVQNKEVSLIKERELPTIEYDKEYLNEHKVVCVEGGRGCPFNCTYCSSSNYWQNNFRMKPIENLISEMEKNTTKNQDRVSIIHDIFTLNKKKIEKFCKKIQDKEIQWSCSARADSLDKDLIKLMKRSGCVGIFLGIETGDQKIQKKINKNLNLDHTDKIINDINDVGGIKIVTSFIVGFPFDKPTSFYNTLKRIFKYKKNECEIKMFTLKPEKGSSLYKEYKNNLFFNNYFYLDNWFAEKIENETEAIKLIEENPDLFSHHYRIKPEHFNAYYFEGLEKIGKAILTSTPQAFYLWMKKFENHPETFFKEIKDIMGWKSPYTITKKELLKLSNKKNILLSFMAYFETNKQYIDKDIKTTYNKELREAKERLSN
ncbi:MAG: B12-binding domain-containing radical SAM protein [Patescibacteria group bacterium]